MLMAFGTMAILLGCGKGGETPSPLAEAARRCAGGDADLSCTVPIFNVRSLRASSSYYRDALGFKIDWQHGEPPDFGSVSRGHSVIFMCQGCQGTPGAWAMLFAPDVDRLHEEFRNKKALIRMAPTNMPWGLREMHVSDPDGNVLRFGSGIDHD
jgi:catechol 2,3-dioxygenase-like lactoylglutathione lyase family enzyme